VCESRRPRFHPDLDKLYALNLENLRCFMKKLFYYIITALAVWLLVSPFLLRYSDNANIAVAVIAALVGGAIAVLAAGKDISWPAKIILGLGAVLFIWGLVGIFHASNAGLNELLVGLLWGGIALVITQIQPAAEMVAYDVYGNPMAQITKISFKKDNLVAKAILLGSMPSTMYIRPEEVWKVLEMISFETLLCLPKFLITGAKRVKEVNGKVETEEQTKPV